MQKKLLMYLMQQQTNLIWKMSLPVVEILFKNKKMKEIFK